MQGRDQVVSVLWSHDRRVEHSDSAPPATTEWVEARVARAFRSEPVDDVAAVLAHLVAEGVARCVDGVWSLTPSGTGPARAVHYDIAQRRFGAWMVTSAQSDAYRTFSRRLYGTEHVQFDMVDAPQLSAALAALELAPGQRVLDLGCGIGALPEAIAAHSGASVHGIDFAEAAITYARERASAGVTYEVALLDDYEPPAGAFDAVVAFDTVYFVENLDRLIARAWRALRPGGRLVLFYSAKRTPDEPEDRLRAEGTAVGRALDAIGAPWTARDFGAEAHDLWRRSLALAKELEEAFEAEGHRLLWEGRVAESEALLEVYEDGRGTRYLYVATR